MKPFINDDFLLQNDDAKILYHDFVKHLPIIDYHSHLDAKILSENVFFKNITQIWLQGDHYKWRAMRALGIDEKYITGNANDEEKFLAWASCVPQTLRNPLFHWTQFELKNTFQINKYLDASNAKELYKQCTNELQQEKNKPQTILNNYKVELLGTTDDPCDDLSYHKQLSQNNKSLNIKPSFRPDKILNIQHKENFMAYVLQLEIASAIKIKNIQTLLEALQNRVNYFHENKCTISDHGLIQMPFKEIFTNNLEQEFASFLQKKEAIFTNHNAFKYYILTELCKMYHKKKWVQQFHLGAIRNNNYRLLNQIGVDAGVDSIGDSKQAFNLSGFLNDLNLTQQLTKTIIYNINPSDNEIFASMAGNFNDGSVKGKIQFGAAWWFNDQKEGIEKQINALSNIGIISTFIGMTTDSRSFLSFSRHEYFRRILCNMFGAEMQQGLLPNDIKWIGEIIQNICYHNAKEYFEIA